MIKVDNKEVVAIVETVQIAQQRINTAISDWLKIHPECMPQDLELLETTLEQAQGKIDLAKEVLSRELGIDFEEGR